MKLRRPPRPPARVEQRAALLRAYVAPEVVAHITSDGALPLLSGVRRPVTVLFADLCNFTRLADTLAPERVVAILDQYFAAMTAAADSHGAMIDKLIGDAIMLIYGVPLARDDDAARALATAAAMHGAFDRLLPAWKGLPRGLRLGLSIGIASGEAVLANVGSALRMDYTIIGTAVNRAARLTAAAGRGETLVDAGVRTAAPSSATLQFGPPRRLVLKGFRRRVLAYPYRPHGRPPPVTTSVATDPVCGMKLDPRLAVSTLHDGRRLHFCSSRCRAAFRRDPRRYE